MPKFDDKGRWVEPTDEEAWHTGKKWVLIVIVVLVLLPLIGFGIKWATAPARGKAAAREQIQANGAYRIAAYNTFFDLCTQVQAQEDRIAIFEPRAQSGDSEAQTNLDAVRANRASLIREYNSKASRSYTEGQFRSSHLPYHLNVDDEETQCDSE